MASANRITSRHNPRVKEAVRLRSGRERRRRGRFLIDGAREIAQAVATGVRCPEAFVCEALCDVEDCEIAIQSLESTGAELLSVTPDVYAKLAFGERDDGVIAVAEMPRRELSELQLPAEPLVAVLEGLEKPGNVGAILRSADAAGVDGVIIADGRTDLYNPNTIRASVGTVFRPNICEATSADALRWLAEHNLPVFAARPDAERLYTEVDLRRAAAIVFGSEAEGVSQAWSGADVTPIRLPMHGIADSLNVSTTAAVLFYEALRQRQR